MWGKSPKLPFLSLYFVGVLNSTSWTSTLLATHPKSLIRCLTDSLIFDWPYNDMLKLAYLTLFPFNLAIQMTYAWGTVYGLKHLGAFID